MNKGCRARGGRKSALDNRRLVINAKCLYEGIIVPASLEGTEAWGAEKSREKK